MRQCTFHFCRASSRCGAKSWPSTGPLHLPPGDNIGEFVRNHPTVYISTHSPQGYENLEAKRVMDLDNPVETIFDEVNFSKKEASGKYVCSVCGYVYDPAEHDGVPFEDIPDDWRCPRCKQPKEKFNKA